MALALDSSGNVLQALRPDITQAVAVSGVSAATATPIGGAAASEAGIAEPPQVPELEMWLEGFDASTLITRASGIDTFVEAWLDKSGRGNNAVQTTAAQQLRLIENGFTNGRASIKGGDASDTHMDIPPLQTDLTAPQTVIGIAKTDVVGTTQRMFGFQESVGSNTNMYVRFASDNRLEFQVRVTSGINHSVKSVAVAADSGYHAWCARLNATPGKIEVALDNEVFQINDSGGAYSPFGSMTAAPMIFAGDSGGTPLQEMQGHVPVLAFFERALSNAEWAGLRDGYLLPLINGAPTVRDVEVIRIAATTDCFIAVGENPVATTADVFLPAGVPEYFTVRAGIDKVAAIRAATDGALSVTEMI